MEIVRLTLGLIAAPVIYFVVGLPWAAVTRLAWAPLWGVGIFGLGAEAARLAGLPVVPALLALGGAHALFAAGLVIRRQLDDASLRVAARDFGLNYALALIPLAVVPFALPGGWGGDWRMALEAGQHVMTGARFTSELLARPPLFGAAAIPLLGFDVPFATFQIFCAIASACVLQAFPARAGAVQSPGWILAGSIFFLQITANAWPKFLCAAFLVAAWQAAKLPARRPALVVGALLGLALATHQSAILFAPLLLYRLWRHGLPADGKFPRLIAAGLVTAAIVLPWEIHTVMTYGWAAKWVASPAVSQRLVEIPAWLNALLVGVTTFVAWGPVEILRHWLAAPDRFSLLRLGHEAYWLATATFNSAAGSLLGLVLPWWVAWGGREFWHRVAAGWAALDRGTKLSLGFALLGQVLLNPFYSSEGSLQTGWVPVGVAVALWFAHEVEAASPERRRRLAHCTWWLGTGPWLAFNLFLTAALLLSPGFHRGFMDSDLQVLERNGWTSLAFAGFPGLQLGLAGFWLLVRWRRHARALSGREPSRFLPIIA